MIILAAVAVVVAGGLGYAFRGKEKKLIAEAGAEIAKIEATASTDVKAAIAKVKAALHL